MMVSLLLPIPFLLLLLAFNKLGLGHPKGFALFYPCWGGIGDDMFEFMVYLYYRFFFGVVLN